MMMTEGYFHRVHRETATRLWINNPTREEAEKAIAAGAINCTTNPSFCSKILDSEGAYVRGIIDEVIKDEDNDDAAAEKVYARATQAIMQRFLPLYQASRGVEGFVTIQGDPRKDDDVDNIVREAMDHQKLSPNFMTKIPVVEAGIQAIGELLERNVPVCATEIFGLAQVVQICEAYQRAVRKTGHNPPFFVTHITGIFDQYLTEYVRREGVDIAPEVLHWAGTAIAHKQYKLMKERGYPGTLLGGGARGLHHFTEMVGGEFHITINWSTAQELIEKVPPVVSRIDWLPDSAMESELADKLPDFRRAYYEDGLSAAEFKDFGPLVLFRNSFLDGYGRLLSEVAARRTSSR